MADALGLSEPHPIVVPNLPNRLFSAAGKNYLQYMFSLSLHLVSNVPRGCGTIRTPSVWSNIRATCCSSLAVTLDNVGHLPLDNIGPTADNVLPLQTSKWLETRCARCSQLGSVDAGICQVLHRSSKTFKNWCLRAMPAFRRHQAAPRYNNIELDWTTPRKKYESVLLFFAPRLARLVRHGPVGVTSVSAHLKRVG